MPDTQKQITRVYDAVAAGHGTSTECAQATGLSPHRCSCCLYELAKSGAIRKSGKTSANRGRPANVYVVAE